MATTRTRGALPFPWLVGLLGAIAAAAGGAGCATVQRGAADVLLPPEQEEQLGEEIDQEIQRRFRMVEDPAVVAYVQAIGERVGLPSEEERGPVTLRFRVIDEPEQVNAFVTVGGNVYVYSGLLLAARNEAELASVLAHEVGHVAERHVARQLAAQFGLSLLAQAALGNDPGLVQQLVTQIAGTGALAAHSRSAEREADRAGVRYLVESGYDPRGAITFFQLLQEMRERRPGWVETFFATHPPPENRIALLREEIIALGAPRGRIGEQSHTATRQRLVRYYAARGIRIG
jgi:beta-barrel assembly-enhancing protease